MTNINDSMKMNRIFLYPRNIQIQKPINTVQVRLDI